MKTPLYYKIYCDLRGQIESQKLKAGDLLPAELELEKIFCASRSPVRQALGLLENEGLIERCPGKGTFVASPREEVQLWFHNSPFRDHIQREWDKIYCRTLAVRKKIPPATVREFFLFGQTQKVICIERIRCVADKTIIYTQHYLHPSCDPCKVKEAGDFYSLKAVLMEKFSIEITRMKDTLRAVAAPAAIAHRLEVPVNTPVLLTCRRSYAEDMPFHFDIFYTLSDLWDYSITYEKGSTGGTSATDSRRTGRRGGGRQRI